MMRQEAAKPEYVKAKTAVWWDINSCPIPHGYDVCRIRPSIESALKSLGYSGPVEITVIGNQEDTPEEVLRGLSSKLISVKHGPARQILLNLLMSWQNRNPPPASMMLISDIVESMSLVLCRRQQRKSGYNLLRAYTCAPNHVSTLYSTAEWLWESLLAAADETDSNKQEVTRIKSSVLQKCTRPPFIWQWPLFVPFDCFMCFFTTKSVEDFTTHLSGAEHQQKRIALERSRMPHPGYEVEENAPEGKEENPPESKRSKMRAHE
uniref:NYN domain-containing protein n=1 Tax=Noccaea caerulescens TaxID=107243 RepID=A0A1J3JB22_NOCCA